jgi:IS1 family transposase
MEAYEDDGTWVWVSFASESRLVIAHAVGERKQYMADKVVETTKKRIVSVPLFVSDGLKFYTKALLKSYGNLVTFPKTRRRGRPRMPKLVLDADLRYAQVIKSKAGGAIRKVKKKVIFGKDIDPKDISTSLVERQNLTLRQDNNRISRKTIGFSKKLSELDKQMTLYFAHFNFCRGHGSLIHLDCLGRKRKSSPAKECGLTDHNWSLRELLTYPYHRISTG